MNPSSIGSSMPIHFGVSSGRGIRASSPFWCLCFSFNSFPGSRSILTHPTFYSMGDIVSDFASGSGALGSKYEEGGHLFSNAVVMGNLVPYSSPVTFLRTPFQGDPIGNWSSGLATLASVGIKAVFFSVPQSIPCLFS